MRLNFIDLPHPLSTELDDTRRWWTIRYALGTKQNTYALEEAQAWVDIHPNSSVPRALLGDVLAALSRMPEALTAYEHALTQVAWSPEPPTALFDRVQPLRYAAFEQMPRRLVLPEPPEPITIEEQDRVYGADTNGQWAITATASTEYRTVGDYSASRATGAPDVTRYGDSPKAWASRQADISPEWLQVTFSNAVHAVAVRVRQVYNPGAIDRVELFTASDQALTVFQGIDTNAYPANQIGWFVVKFPRTREPIQRVRIALDSARVKGWNEIDAVQLVHAPVTVSPPPVLTYTFDQEPGTLKVAIWPEGFLLERATQLSPADWQPYAATPPATIPIGGKSAFFRLAPIH